MDRTERCETCRFWEPTENPTPASNATGLCCRFPQCVDKLQMEWCGEWQAAEGRRDRDGPVDWRKYAEPCLEPEDEEEPAAYPSDDSNPSTST